MPEIGECYSTASKIPALNKVDQVILSKNFFKYISKTKNFKKILGENPIIQKPFAYGKSVWIPFLNQGKQGVLVSQMGMSGSWFLNDLGRPKKNDHLTLVSKKTTLRYSDPRMFGKFRIFTFDTKKTSEEMIEVVTKNYNWGLDPYRSSEIDILESLKRWQKSSKPVKALILDQNVVFGIGNYLASEILFLAKVHPKTKGSSLSLENLKEISKELKKMVDLAVEREGFSFAGGYFHPDGEKGTVEEIIQVYNKEGILCPSCRKDKIKKINVAGRSTYLCPKCQKEK